MIVTEEKPVATKATEPAKRWRNWWHEIRGRPQTSWRPPYAVIAHHKVGETYPGELSWPSLETAEQAATEAIEKGWALREEYLGAYPEGERP